MTTTLHIDREQIHVTFSQWQADHDALDAQVAESIAALEAYQSHLDAWQRELAAERGELERMRAELESGEAAPGPQSEQVEALQRELDETRQKHNSLTSALLTRTEELRELDKKREQAEHDLAQAKAGEKELLAALEAERKQSPSRGARSAGAPVRANEQIRPGENSNSASQPVAVRGPADPNKSPNPVLGSVMEQFGKLRQQRSLGRQNNPKLR